MPCCGQSSPVNTSLPNRALQKPQPLVVKTGALSSKTVYPVTSVPVALPSLTQPALGEGLGQRLSLIG